MRSPFSFISSRVRVVMLDMLAPAIQLGDFALPEIAIRQLGVWNHQVRLPHDARSVAYDVEIQGPGAPPLAALPAALRFYLPAPRQQIRRAETRFEQHHLIQIWRLRNRAKGSGFLDLGNGDDAGSRKLVEAGTGVRQMSLTIAHVRAQCHVDPLRRRWRSHGSDRAAWWPLVRGRGWRARDRSAPGPPPPRGSRRRRLPRDSDPRCSRRH